MTLEAALRLIADNPPGLRVQPQRWRDDPNWGRLAIIRDANGKVTTQSLVGEQYPGIAVVDMAELLGEWEEIA